MPRGLKETLLKQIDELAGVAERITASDQEVVPAADVQDIVLGGKHIVSLLGNEGMVWAWAFDYDQWNFHEVRLMLGALKSLRRAIADDLLVRFELLVRSEVFDDLLEQAEHLLERGYHIAAGVLARGVLEDHLRRWCDREGCSPARAKPTIADLNQSLYGSQLVDKLTMKHVESMAAVGNDAAHNVPTLAAEPVERLVRDVRQFVSHHGR